MGTIVLIIFALVIVGLVVWFYIKNNKPDSEPVVPEPIVPEPVVPDTPDVPDKPEDSDDKPDDSSDEPEPEPQPEPTPDPEPEPEPEPQVTYDTVFEEYLSAFNTIVEIKRDSKTYDYMHLLFRETYSQYLDKKTLFGIPIMHKIENFPTLYEFGSTDDSTKALGSIIGWALALQLAELRPYDRASIFKIGYELGGYTKYDNIYGYTFNADPNIARIAASFIYVSMRGKMKPDIESMRAEVGGVKYTESLSVLADDKRDHVSDDAFFTDFRKFMPTAPAPYAPGYTNRPDRTYPNEERDDYDNLKVDRQIHEMIVEMYNLKQTEHYQETVQAIADKELDCRHLLGKNKKTEHYQFHPVFGEDTIGIELNDNGNLAEFVSLAVSTSSASRGIMQSATVDPKQYGRLRPGCSWNQEAKKNSSTDDRRNVLVEVEIEDNDGCKETPNTFGHYDKDGYWVYTQTEKDQYAETQKNNLWANSYPSGHSAGIIGGAMVLAELMPEKAHLIMRAANTFAVDRTIARYHWTSDTLNGRVLGAATNAVAHASKDYDELLAKALIEL